MSLRFRLRSIKRIGGALLVSLVLTGCAKAQPRVVLYCSQDEPFATEVLGEFTRRTGIEVATKFDTEADKSVSLFLELLAEKERPRCDVFWNNEILSTIRLQQQDLLSRYDSPAGIPYPPSCRATDDTWHAFAARARVMLVNTDRIPEADRPRSLLDLAQERWRNRAVMARPQFGTSATQASCLFEVLGRDAATTYYKGLKTNGIQIAPGNKQVAEWVGQGRTPGGQRVDVGVTDTDDALEEIAAGRHVAMIFPDREAADKRMGTLYIPNTLAIIRNGPNPVAARRLVDYLLSPEIEAKLATGASHQIPLNREVHADLPPGLETPATARPMRVDFATAANLWEEVQTFLRNEFATPD